MPPFFHSVFHPQNALRERESLPYLGENGARCLFRRFILLTNLKIYLKFLTSRASCANIYTVSKDSATDGSCGLPQWSRNPIYADRLGALSESRRKCALFRFLRMENSNEENRNRHGKRKRSSRSKKSYRYS